MRGNIIEIVLSHGRIGQTQNLFQYDQGQKLRIKGEVPGVYAVHFSNQELGHSKTVIAESDMVDIPDEYLLSGEDIHLWVYVSGEDHSETEYHGVINVIPRAQPSDEPPTPEQESVLNQAISALNSATEEMAGVMETIEETVHNTVREAVESGEFDGFSPTVDVSQDGNDTTIIVTDKTGTSSATIHTEDPQDLIDDTAGNGVTNKVWSADKSYDELNLKAPKRNPTFEGSISLGRLDSTPIGFYSSAEGYGVTASGDYSHAEGQNTIASKPAQHVFGKNNVEDTQAGGKYVEIVGNGSAANRPANARALDWEGNEYLAGDVYVHSGTNSSGGKKLTTMDEVTEAIASSMEGIQSFDVEIVEELPAYPNTHTLYFLRAENGKSRNLYEEYMYIGNRYELVGTTDVDISTKADKADTVLDTTLSRGRKANTNVGFASFAFGENVTASGTDSHAEGNNTQATGYYSHAEGYESDATAYASHAEGGYTEASGTYSHAEGEQTRATNSYAHAEGHFAIASGLYSHAEGYAANASASASHAEGNNTAASGISSHAEGWNTRAMGDQSHAEGVRSVNSDTRTIDGVIYRYGAYGNSSHAEGENTIAGSNASHAEGSGTAAIAISAHAEGGGTTASGGYSHAEGGGTTASGDQAHSEGAGTQATGTNSHAEGGGTIASGVQSHAEGAVTQASGLQSHAEGSGTIASGDMAHAEGWGTKATGNYSHVNGKFNIEDSQNTYATITGNGPSDSSCSNAYALDWNGTGHFAGDVYVNCNNDSTGGSKLVSMADIPIATIAETQAIIDAYDEEEDEGMVVETEYYYDAPNEGYKSVMDAADIINAFKAGKNIVVHFESIASQNIPDSYAQLLYYADTSSRFSQLAFRFAYSDYTSDDEFDVTSLFGDPGLNINIGQDGKLYFPFVSD